MYRNGKPIEDVLLAEYRRSATLSARHKALEYLQDELRSVRGQEVDEMDVMKERYRRRYSDPLDRRNDPEYITELEERIARLKRCLRTRPTLEKRRAQTRERVRRYRERKQQ